MGDKQIEERQVTTTPTVSTADTTTDSSWTDTTKDPEERMKELIAQLETKFGRDPKAARAAVLALAKEFPGAFSADWAAGMLAKIDAAADRAILIREIEQTWDRKPGTALGACAQLKRVARGDAKLLRWVAEMTIRIQVHQEALLLDATFHTRPTDAIAHVKALHRLKPSVYTQDFVVRTTRNIKAFQDAAWAMKVSKDEVIAWLGENVVDVDAPPEVIAELRVQIGRAKRDAAFGKGGSGATDKRITLPSTEDQRRQALDKSDDKAKNGFTFTSEENIPAKRLEVIADQTDIEANQTQKSKIPTQQPTNNILQMQPDVMTQLLNQALDQRTRDLEAASQASRLLAQRLRSGETTVDKERNLLMADVRALEWEKAARLDQIAELDKAGNTEDAAKVRSTLEGFDRNVELIQKVLSDPKGVMPGAGKLDAAFGNHPAIVPLTKEEADVASVTNKIDSIFGDVGVGRETNALLVGLVRFGGRLTGIEAGINRIIANAASLFLPDSVTAPMKEAAQSLYKSSVALRNAGSQVTMQRDEARLRWERTIGPLGLLETALSNEKIAEAPDNAIFAVLTAIPETAPAAITAQFVTSTAESFFTEYGKSGSLKDSMTAAGWSVLQSAAGLALTKLGIPASGSVSISIAMVVGIGKMRGLSNDKIEEQVMMTLVAAGVSAGVGGIRAKTHQLVDDVQGGGGTRDVTTSEAKLDPKLAGEYDRVSGELSNASVKSRELLDKLAVENKAGRDTRKLTTELEQTTKLATQKKLELEKLFTAEQTSTTQLPPIPKPDTPLPTTTTTTTTTSTAPVEAKVTTVETVGNIQRAHLDNGTIVERETLPNGQTVERVIVADAAYQRYVGNYTTGTEPNVFSGLGGREYYVGKNDVFGGADKPAPSSMTMDQAEAKVGNIAVKGEMMGGNQFEGTCFNVAVRNSISAALAGLESRIILMRGWTPTLASQIVEKCNGLALQVMGRALGGSEAARKIDLVLGRTLGSYKLDGLVTLLNKYGLGRESGHAIAEITMPDGSKRYISWGTVRLDWEDVAQTVYATYKMVGDDDLGRTIENNSTHPLTEPSDKALQKRGQLIDLGYTLLGSGK